jgi:hypothetical protein
VSDDCPNHPLWDMVTVGTAVATTTAFHRGHVWMMSDAESRFCRNRARPCLAWRQLPQLLTLPEGSKI